jgi:hypothetical protein
MLQPAAAFGLLVIALFIYISCRLHHMNALYGLVANSRLSQLVVKQTPADAKLTYRDREKAHTSQIIGLNSLEVTLTLELWWAMDWQLIGSRAERR